MLLRKFWDSVSNIGLDETDFGKDVVKIRLFNQLIVIALVTSILALIVYWITDDKITIIYTTLANIFLEIFALCMAFMKRHQISRFTGLFIFPTLIATHILVLGKNFGEANIFSAIALAAVFIYEGNKSLRIISVVYITILFIVAKLVSIEMFNSQYDNSNPYDEIITFPATILVLGLIIVLYQKSLDKYDDQKLEFIQNLKEKNDELAVLNEELEEFTYIASHDLKSPLRTVSSHLDLIRLHIKRKNFEAIEEDIKFAKKGTKQMYALISDILEYKELSSDEFEEKEINLNEVLIEVLETLKVEITNSNAAIYLIDQLPNIIGRERDFVVLFQKIIQNGIQYNESITPEIEIYSKVETNQISIFLKDNGIGISKEYHEKVFQFFKRLHTKENYDGTGVGLGLCRKIVRSYKGEILIAESGNNGSVFQIIFPK